MTLKSLGIKMIKEYFVTLAILAVGAGLYSASQNQPYLESLKTALFVGAILLTVYSIFYKINIPNKAFYEKLKSDSKEIVDAFNQRVNEQYLHFLRAGLLVITALLFDLLIYYIT